MNAALPYCRPSFCLLKNGRDNYKILGGARLPEVMRYLERGSTLDNENSKSCGLTRLINEKRANENQSNDEKLQAKQ